MHSRLLSLATFSLTAFAVALLPPAMAGDLYKWTDEKGQVHYTSTPPPDNAKKAATIDSKKLNSINALPSDPHKNRADESKPADDSGPAQWTPTQTTSSDIKASAPASPPMLIPPSLLPQGAPPATPNSPPTAKTTKFSGDLLSLNYDDIEVRTVLQVLADFVGLNIVVSDSVKGTVTLRLQNVPWDQALEIILQRKGLAYRQDGNVIFIGSLEEIAAKNLQTVSNPTAQPATGDIVEVVAQGMGIDANAALVNAYSNAVQQALGLYVDAETLVQNDEIVRDKILTYSKGFIQEATTVKQSQVNGLFQVNIRAKVKRQQLLEQAKANNITVKAVEGVSLHAQVETQLRQEQDGKALLKKVLLPLMGATLYRAELAPSAQEQPNPTINKAGTNNDFVTLDYKVQLQIDGQEYIKYVKNILIPVLNQIAIRKGEFTVTYERYNDGYMVKFETFGKAYDDKKEISFNILTWRDKGLTTSKWQWFAVPIDETPQELFSSFCGKIIELSLLDEKGEIVALSNLKLNDDICYSPIFYISGYKKTIISPDFFNSHLLGNFISLKSKPISVKIAREDLLHIKSAKLEVKED